MVSRARSNTTEIAFIGDLICKEVDKLDPAQTEEKILLCGSWCEVATCLEYINSQLADKHIFPHIVVATNEIDPFVSAYMGKDQIELVEWNEREYEEILVERVKQHNAKERHIRLAIDFQPTTRRIQRIRDLLEPNGTLVIPHEKPIWRLRHTNLMRSFTANGGHLIKLSETVPTANANRQLQQALAQEYRLGIKWTPAPYDVIRER